MYVPRAMYSLNVVLQRALELAERNALLLSHCDVHRQQNRRTGVDSHGCRHAIERDAVEQPLEILDAVDRDTRSPDFSFRPGMIGVVSHLRRQIERDRETGLPHLQQMMEPLVGLLGRPEPRVLAHRPEPAAIHRRIGTTRERRLTGQAEVTLGTPRPIVRSVVRLVLRHLPASTARANATSCLEPMISGV